MLAANPARCKGGYGAKLSQSSFSQRLDGAYSSTVMKTVFLALFMQRVSHCHLASDSCTTQPYHRTRAHALHNMK